VLRAEGRVEHREAVLEGGAHEVREQQHSVRQAPHPLRDHDHAAPVPPPLGQPLDPPAHTTAACGRGNGEVQNRQGAEVIAPSRRDSGGAKPRLRERRRRTEGRPARQRDAKHGHDHEHVVRRRPHT
jgi:hypothetical protein